MKTATKTNNARFVFFGTAPLAIAILDELEQRGMKPTLIVAGVDKIDARTKKTIFPPEKEWALKREIDVAQPEKIDGAFLQQLEKETTDTCIVASYGKILPKALLDIPKHGILNVHPSLLPRLRGPSPIRSSILNDEKETGVTVILMDEKMDHGPVIAQKKVALPERPMHGLALDDLLAREGAILLADYLPRWLSGEVEPRRQNDDVATYCSFLSKEDGLIDLNADAYQNLLKIRAFEGWPGTFSFVEKQGKKIRIKIIDAHIEAGKLVLNRVVPEGKKEMSFEEFARR